MRKARPKAAWVVVRCPPGEELARGSWAECVYVKRVLEDLCAHVHRTHEYVILSAQQWDEG